MPSSVVLKAIFTVFLMDSTARNIFYCDAPRILILSVRAVLLYYCWKHVPLFKKERVPSEVKFGM